MASKPREACAPGAQVVPTDEVLTDNGYVQTIKAKVPRSNAGVGGRLFLRVRVTQ